MYSRPLPHRHPFSDFFWGEGAVVHRLSEMDNPSSNFPLKLTDKQTDIVRRIVHSKLKPFHFQIEWYYLSDANYQTDNPSHTDNPSLVWNAHECRAPASSWAFAGCFCFFKKIIFKLTVDISIRKIILQVEYFIRSIMYQMLKFFKRIAYFIPRWS